MNASALTEKIADWLRDEADRELPSGYVCIIGGEDEKKQREPVVRQRFILRQYIKTPEIFLRIGFVRSYLKRRAIKAGKAFFEDMIGECLLKELDDVDAVLIYLDRLLQFYDSFLKEDPSAETDIEDLEEVTRGFTRHECRHACQFTELRKLGADPSSVLEWEFTSFDYGEGPLETDAFLYQFHAAKQSISEVCHAVINEQLGNG